MAAGSTESALAAAAQKKLLKLTRKRLERFVTFVPKFLVNDDPDTIHDLRVRSRRLQQTFRIILPQIKTPAGRKVIRTLRRVRRALGPSRNVDVNIELVEQRFRAAKSPALRDGWEALRTHLQEMRQPLLANARKDVAKYDFVTFIERARKLIAHADLDADPTAKMAAAVARALAQWDEAYALAQESRNVENLHALRIATKRLRYRAELLADSGSGSIKPTVKDLKEIQAALGDWHDRSVLIQFAAEFLARPDFLENHPDIGGALLTEMEKEKQVNDAAIEKISARAAKLRKRWSDRQA
ncbi:MAG: CHAD domain-containing protein [Candidatus Binatia bacterium]